MYIEDKIAIIVILLIIIISILIRRDKTEYYNTNDNTHIIKDTTVVKGNKIKIIETHKINIK